MALALGNAHRVYAQRFNSTYGRSGHLWQNRFFSTALGRSETLVALAYGDLNPVRAGLVGQAEQWPGSSAQAHVDGQDRTGTIDWQACRRYCDLDNWATVLATDGYRAEGILLRRAAAAGIPYADEALTAELEEREGRPLRPKHRTRSKRRVAAASI